MWPAASVSGWYFSHPQAQYFGVGKIAPDQLADYASRAGLDIAAAEKNLASNLGYLPEPGATGDDGYRKKALVA